MRLRLRAWALALVAIGAAPPAVRPVHAQVVPARADTARVDTAAVRRAALDTTTRAPRRRTALSARPRAEPPISPRRALLYSLAVPGFGQAKLDRARTGALFAAVELGAVTMARKSAYDLRVAKAFRQDTGAVTAPVDSLGRPVAGARGATVFTPQLVRARRVHYEDWLAVIAFNHLFAGAEAFVSANLWDLPAEISARRDGRTTTVAISVAW